jgi:hypothetical protein
METDLSKDLEKVGGEGCNVKMNLKEREWEVVDWFHATHHRDQWRVLVYKKIKLQFPEHAEYFNRMSNCQLLKTCTAVCSLLTTYSCDAASDI